MALEISVPTLTASIGWLLTDFIVHNIVPEVLRFHDHSLKNVDGEIITMKLK